MGERAKEGRGEPAITRRAFAWGLGGIVGLVAVGGLGKATLGSDSLLRPPGGQDEAGFLAGCLRCDKCRSICPQNCIVDAALEDGFVSYRTPKIDFHRGYCTFCDECIDVCPTKALASFDEASEKIGIATIDADECIAYKRGGCRACVDACEYGAISLDGSNRPVVDGGKCNGCGKCEYVCPSASYGSYSGTGLRGVNVQAGKGA